MLFPSSSAREQSLEILRGLNGGALGEVEAAERLLKIDPNYAAAFLMLGNARKDAGDLTGAESLFWRGLDLQPCKFPFYLALSDVRRKRDPADVLANHLMLLAMWKLSFADEIPDTVSEAFRRGSSKLDFKDPETYEMLATAIEIRDKDAEDPPEVADRLLPYRLLNDLERQAPAVVDYRLVRDIVAHPERCAPLLHAALREWGRNPLSLSSQALCMILALLGEIAPIDVLDDLLDLATFDEEEVFLHAHWAIWRLGQRFPAEALAKFRAATPSAHMARRCALAEQINLLPQTDGIVPALLDLLEGFSASADNADAPYLLMVIMHALAELGKDAESQKVFATYQGSLTRKGRKALQEWIDLEDEFLPKLVAEEIDARDIEDICIGRVYIEDKDDEDEDDEDEDDEEDDESLEPAAPIIKPGRNDPCWCGSGKKYKKCHLSEDEDAARGRSPGNSKPQPEQPLGDPFYAALYRKVSEAASQIRSSADFLEANRLYFDQPVEEVDPEEAATGGFFEWYFFDFRPGGTGRTLVEEYLRRRGPHTAGERALLESWRGARFGLFEVQSIKPETGVDLKDVFAGDQFFVHDVSSSRSSVQWDCIFSRIQHYEGQWIFSGNGFLLARPLLPRFRAIVEEESLEAGQTPAEFVRANSHQWYRVLKELHQDQIDGLRMVNAEGDEITFSSAVYLVRDADDVANTLAGLEFFEETTGKGEASGVRHFGWLETGVAEGGPRRSYGHIEIRDGRLRLECSSRRRLEIGRQLLEKNVGSFLTHQGDTFESTSAAMERIRRERPPKEKVKKIPPEIERELLLELKAKHYAKWPDESLPALDGKTPREAVRSEVGRTAVENLIRMMENGEERDRKEGAAAFDFSSIRETLGLDR